MDREKVIEASGAVDWEPDPILGKSEEDARAEVIDVTFSWAATNTVAGHEIWNRAVAWQKGQSAKQQDENRALREALEYYGDINYWGCESDDIDHPGPCSQRLYLGKGKAGYSLARTALDKLK